MLGACTVLNEAQLPCIHASKTMINGSVPCPNVHCILLFFKPATCAFQFWHYLSWIPSKSVVRQAYGGEESWLFWLFGLNHLDLVCDWFVSKLAILLLSYCYSSFPKSRCHIVCKFHDLCRPLVISRQVPTCLTLRIFCERYKVQFVPSFAWKTLLTRLVGDGIILYCNTQHWSIYIWHRCTHHWHAVIQWLPERQLPQSCWTDKMLGGRVGLGHELHLP